MTKRVILPIIVLSQFCCTSLWFAGNAVMSDLIIAFGLPTDALSSLTSAVQFGFISGTLIFALLMIADRFSPSLVFFVCAILGALCNYFTIFEGNNLSTLLLFRFLTGFFLAGIYPVGMKIASDYYQKGLGKSLGYLVGALVIGTAFPHLLKSIQSLDYFHNSQDSQSIFSWRLVIQATSLIAVLGGVLMFAFVPNRSINRSGKSAQKIKLTAFFQVFKSANFRSAAFGYFGHMWELYTFWAFVPIILLTYSELHPEINLNISFLSFLIIGLGSFACVIGGYLSERFGTKKIAFASLSLSALCCLVSPLIFYADSYFLLITFLIFWGLVVIADSPLFSTLVAQSAISELKGTALTIVNCIGFAITIVSIQFINMLSDFPNFINEKYIFTFLALGPFLGLVALRGKADK
ncbi:MFS transporter [Bernardetia sp. Wsw4-3y2]|uniref:MFS transporter n=1 Tax=Bernardetia sp. Wsw4-3y2 TaxID=3127471 RepID=UPI0030CA5F73